MNQAQAQELVETYAQEASVTVCKVQDAPWGALVEVDMDEVSEDAGEIFLGTRSLSHRPLGVNSDFIDCNLVMVAFVDEEGAKRFAVGRHTMAENNDESHGASFHGHVAIPDAGGEDAARGDMRARHAKDVAADAREMLQTLLGLVAGLPAEAMAGLTRSAEARRFMRLMAASA